MSRCNHRWCEIDEASTFRKFVFRCWKCRAIVEFELRLTGLHSVVTDHGVGFVSPVEVVELAEGMLALALREHGSPVPQKRHKKWAIR